MAVKHASVFTFLLLFSKTLLQIASFKEVSSLNLANANIDVLLTELNAKRIAMHMSYQNLADACQVSQATVIRVLKHQSDPSLPLLQKMAIALKYEPKQEPIVLTSYTQDDYVRFLQQSLEREIEDSKLQQSQQEAHYNMLLAQKTRTITLLAAALMLLASAFITWLIFDIISPSSGWIQQEAVAALRSFFRI